MNDRQRYTLCFAVAALCAFVLIVMTEVGV